MQPKSNPGQTPVQGDDAETKVKQAEDLEKVLVSSEVSPADPAASTPAAPAASFKDPQASRPSMGRTFGIVAVLTVVSKFIGLVRDVVLAQAYGTSIISDAYNVAYLFTGNVLILFGGLGGPFHQSTVAIMTPRKDNESSGKLLTQIFLVSCLVLSIITVLACLFLPGLIDLYMQMQPYAIDHSRLPKVLQDWTDEKLILMYKNQVREQFLIMSPLIVISGLVGISYGILNVHNRIFWPSLSPAIASIAIIVAILCFVDPQTALYTGAPLAVGTLAGAIGQLIAQIPDLLKTKIKWGFTTQEQEGMKEFSAMFWPAILSTSIGQLTVYIDCFFTNTIGQGSWTAVLMSNRLVQLPLGILLTAMLVPILPRFTQLVEAERTDDLKEEVRRSLRFLCFLAFPMAAIFLVIPDPIIRLLFERGEFNSESTQLVSVALIYLAPSILFYVARDLMTRVFYAFKDSKSPFYVALVAIASKAILDWLFIVVLKMDVRGISLASTLITILNLTLLTSLLKAKIGLLGFSKLIKPLFLMILASTLCAGAAYGVVHCFELPVISKFFEENSARLNPLNLGLNAARFGTFVRLFLEVGTASLVSGLVYLIACIVFKLDELNMLSKRVPALARFIGAKNKVDSPKQD